MARNPKKTQQVLREVNRVLRDGGNIGLDAIPRPKKDYYLGRVKNSKLGTENPFLVTSSNLVLKMPSKVKLWLMRKSITIPM